MSFFFFYFINILIVSKYFCLCPIFLPKALKVIHNKMWLHTQNIRLLKKKLIGLYSRVYTDSDLHNSTWTEEIKFKKGRIWRWFFVNSLIQINTPAAVLTKEFPRNLVFQVKTSDSLSHDSTFFFWKWEKSLWNYVNTRHEWRNIIYININFVGNKMSLSSSFMTWSTARSFPHCFAIRETKHNYCHPCQSF